MTEQQAISYAEQMEAEREQFDEFWIHSAIPSIQSLGFQSGSLQLVLHIAWQAWKARAELGNTGN